MFNAWGGLRTCNITGRGLQGFRCSSSACFRFAVEGDKGRDAWHSGLSTEGVESSQRASKP